MLVPMMTMAVTLVGLAAGPASAKSYPPPSIDLLCATQRFFLTVDR